MGEAIQLDGKQPRRRFLTGLLAGITGLAALILAPRRARTLAKETQGSDTGPILYHRTEEAERYYKTLYL